MLDDIDCACGLRLVRQDLKQEGGLVLQLLRFSVLLTLCIIPTYSFGWWAWTPGDHVDDSIQNSIDYGYHPDQPIPFSHKVHADERGISCQFCHSSARRSITAGIPSVKTCMGCHEYVNTNAESIKQIKKHYDENKPLEWNLVHKVPDYVRFSHRIHANAKDQHGKPLLGKDDDEVCMACHGPVKKMTTAAQWAPLQMGWCVDCHNRIKVPATADKAAVRFASVSCNTCHY